MDGCEAMVSVKETVSAVGQSCALCAFESCNAFLPQSVDMDVFGVCV